MEAVPFDFQARTRIVFGAGAIDRLGEVVLECGGRHVLVVSDPGVVAAGHTGRGIASLERAGLRVALFDGVEENPTTRHVRRGVEFARARDVDSIVGLGGGSAMDCAKGINFIYSSGGEMKDYWGVGKARRPLLPMVAVPTTAGTGSESQSFALIADEVTHQKMACGDKRAACRAAILDPETTLSQPPRVTAATGIDAIAHAVETYVTTRRNAMSLAFSREAWRLLDAHLERVLEAPADLEARAAMQIGASLAGLAIESSMLGAAHSAANPLTARYGIVHGNAVGLMLPHVVRFNAAAVESDYRALAELSAFLPRNPTAEALAERLAALSRASGLHTTLSSAGVREEDLAVMAEEAASQWTAQFNPRTVKSDDFLALYRAAY